jgi:hypothetical protein
MIDAEIYYEKLKKIPFIYGFNMHFSFEIEPRLTILTKYQGKGLIDNNFRTLSLKEPNSNTQN